MELEYWNIILGIVIIIIVYYVYLNNTKNSKNNNKNIETFQSQCNSSSGNSSGGSDSGNTIEKLIETKENNNFNARIWDNQSYLSSIYNNKMPNTLLECAEKGTDKVFSNCPTSIWRPNMSGGYDSIGDIMTRTLKNPSTELITDIRKPKIPGAITEKNLSTISVSGIETKEVEDFLYVGGFGNGMMIDRLEKSDLYYRTVKQLNFYLEIYNKALNDKINEINKKIDLAFNNSNDTIVSYINGIISLYPITPTSSSSVVKLNEFLRYKNNNNEGIFKVLSETQFVPQKYNIVDKKDIFGLVRGKKIEYIPDPPSFKYDITFKNQIITNPYSIKNLTKGMPNYIVDEIFKNSNIKNEMDGIPLIISNFKIDNLSIGKDKIFGILSNNNLFYFSNDPEHNKDDNKTKHFLITSKKGIQIIITAEEKYSYGNDKYDTRTFRYTKRNVSSKTQTSVFTLGKLNEEDQIVLSNHEAEVEWDDKTKEYKVGHNSQILNINSISVGLHPNLINSLYNEIYNDPVLKEKYNNIEIIINKIKQIYPQMSKNTYDRLSIWQPVPPPGYVALGFIFTNDEKEIKPSKQLIKCIPESCVKSFKRRPWSPKEDIIFRYTDNLQSLVFYRNPFLGTIVVIDEKKQNGIYKDKTPLSIKYRNEKESLNWECFDIIPCIKGCDYVKNLEMADKNSKEMCKAFSGIENKFFDKTEVKQSLIEEENKLNSLLKGKKQYLGSLMNKLDKMMSEDELYKLISQGLNRYKIKKDLEEQRKLHGEVADKLMRTRGLEIGWGNPDDMSKFKELVKNLVVAQYTVKGPKRDCPVCKLPDTADFVKLKDLELCYGCMEDAVRELIGKKKTAGEPVPQELLDLQNNF